MPAASAETFYFLARLRTIYWFTIKIWSTLNTSRKRWSRFYSVFWSVFTCFIKCTLSVFKDVFLMLVVWGLWLVKEFTPTGVCVLRSQSYGASPVIWRHTMLRATWYIWTRPVSTPARQSILHVLITEEWKAKLTLVLVGYTLCLVKDRPPRPHAIKMTNLNVFPEANAKFH